MPVVSVLKHVTLQARFGALWVRSYGWRPAPHSTLCTRCPGLHPDPYYLDHRCRTNKLAWPETNLATSLNMWGMSTPAFVSTATTATILCFSQVPRYADYSNNWRYACRGHSVPFPRARVLLPHISADEPG